MATCLRSFRRSATGVALLYQQRDVESNSHRALSTIACLKSGFQSRIIDEALHFEILIQSVSSQQDVFECNRIMSSEKPRFYFLKIARDNVVIEQSSAIQEPRSEHHSLHSDVATT